MEQLGESKTLQLIKPESTSVEDKAVMLLIDGSDACAYWINEPLPVMQWLGYRAKAVQKHDLQQAPEANCAGMLIVSRPNEVVQDWLLNQTEVPVFCYGTRLDAAGTFSPDGELSRHKCPKFMSEAHGAYCVQCN